MASHRFSAASIGMQGLRTPEPEPMEHMLERMQQQVQAQPQDAASWVELQSELILRQALAKRLHRACGTAVDDLEYPLVRREALIVVGITDKARPDPSAAVHFFD